MTDKELGDAIRKCISDLHKAIRAARKAGLTVDLQLAVLLGARDDRDFDPHNAVTINKET